VVISPYIQAADMVKEAGGLELDQCYQCGLCTGSCPWNQVRRFPVRQLIHQAQLGVIDFASDDNWLCTTCYNCVQRCPRGVSIIDIMKAIRKVISETGIARVPDSLWLALTNIAGSGNPLGQPAEQRGSWAISYLKNRKPAGNLLYFPCCIPAYDPKAKKVAHSTARIFEYAGVEYNLLPDVETCCGESVRKSGYESLFTTLAEKNIKAFSSAGITRVIVNSPHCYHTFKNEYPLLGASFETLHIVQYLSDMIDQGKLKFRREVKKKVAYHDSCYLARHNKIYDEPRHVLESIPGIELLELPDNRENTLCCGGGGGRIWMDTKKGERFSDLRLKQAVDAGAEILVVSCPYCLLNFEDSLLNLPENSAFEIKDLVELVCEGLM